MRRCLLLLTLAILTAFFGIPSGAGVLGFKPTGAFAGLVQEEQPGADFTATGVQDQVGELFQGLPVVRPTLARQEADELGAVAGIDANGVGRLAGGVQGVQAGDHEARQQRDRGAGQFGRGEEGLGKGQGSSEDHGWDSLCLGRVVFARGESITQTRLRKGVPSTSHPFTFTCSAQLQSAPARVFRKPHPRWRFGLRLGARRLAANFRNGHLATPSPNPGPERAREEEF